MKTLAFFIVASILATGLIGNSYAHKSQVIGDYKLEIGWIDEPPIAGIDNAIELVVTVATEFDKQHAMEDMNMDMNMEHENMDENMTEGEHSEDEEHMESEHEETTEHEEESMEHSEHEETNEMEMTHEEGEGVSGLEDSIELLVILDGEETPLTVKTSDFLGVYHAEFLPSTTGFPIVRISATIGEQEIVDLDMHPEEIEPLSTLAPLHQIEHGIDAADVECKEGLDLYMKTFDESAVCVSSTTADMLMKRGWLSLF